MQRHFVVKSFDAVNWTDTENQITPKKVHKKKHKSNLPKTSASAGLQDTKLTIQPYTTVPPTIPTAHLATVPRLLGQPPIGTSESSHLRPTHPGSNATTVTPREDWYGVYADWGVLGGDAHW